MSIRKVNFVEGEFYHIYNRGNSKQAIFKDKLGYRQFIELLYLANSNENFNLFDLKRVSNFNVFDIERKTRLVAIGAYCSMPNHFHILLTPLVDGGISKFMQKLTTAYVMYFNKRHIRTGSLFEGKFKSEHVSDDKYLKYLFSYIHLNPVKLIQKDWKEIGLKDKKKAILYLSEYSYSSYIDYFGGKRESTKILNNKPFPSYFPTKDHFVREILGWINLR